MQHPPARFLLRMALIVVGASALGFAVNLLSPRGISLTQDHRPPPPSPPAPSMTVSAEQLLEAVNDSNVLVLDARDKDLFLDGHIQGASSLPVRMFDELLEESLPFLAGRAIITYCTGIHCPDSTDLANRLMEQGIQDVKIFHGGWEEWTELGLPTQKGEGRPLWEGM